jgi:simple sugar transport system ATP-binding protein
VVVAEAIDVTKHFGSTVALENVTLTIKAGESHALVGRNGAGKSTLVSLLTGMTAPDGGSIRLAGTPAAAISDRAWWRRNVACVYQRSTIVPALTVAENLFLNRQSDGAVINWSDLERRAAALLREYEVDVDVTAIAGSLDVEARQMVEIARALSGGARFIILDEPTAKLDGKAVARLFRRMRTLQAGGVTFLYISHHLEEIASICETVTVLRDARHVVTARTSELSRDALVEAITGEPKGTRQRRVRTTVDPAQRPVLVIEGLGLPGQFESASLDVRAGEILGLAGSASSGATALAECVAGLRRPASGHIAVSGRTVTSGSVPASLAAGIGFVPPDRQANGFVPGLGVAENMTMPITPRLGHFGVIMGRRRDSIAGRLAARLAVKASSLSQPVGSLSGGNQQKVVMGRAISGEPRVLVLVNPTAGIDVRSKESLIEVIEDGAIGGQAVLVVTDDLEDLRSCDRVLVMFRGVITKEFRGQWLDHDLVSAMEGLGDHTIA